jgi:mannonate dehydratase
MPVIDWVRTDLHYRLPSGGEVMFFDYPTFAAFDVYIIKRPNAAKDYSEEMQEKAQRIFKKLSEEEKEKLAYNIIVYTQGFIHGSIGKNEVDYKNAFLHLLDKYADIDHKILQQNLVCFLNDILPTAEKYGIKMCIHPDDPPFPLLGLPRIVSTKENLDFIFSGNNSASNGLTFCSGSFSAIKSNDLESILEKFKDKVHFIHLRNNKVYDDGSFHESGHIDGDVNMPVLIRILLEEQLRRIRSNESSIKMPVRPDHGIRMMSDFNRESPPGYPLYGRMRGLNEIRGMETAITYLLL